MDNQDCAVSGSLIYFSVITFTFNGDVCVSLTNKCDTINISGQIWTSFDSQPTLTASFQNAVQLFPSQKAVLI